MIVTNLLFSRSMVRAIIREIEQPGAGKTETRRCVTPIPAGPIQPLTSFNHGRMEVAFGPANRSKDGPKWWRPPAQAGDLIYVREAWRVGQRWDGTAPRDLPPRTMTVFFEAGGSISGVATLPKDKVRPLAEYVPDLRYPNSMPDWAGQVRQSMHLPRWASRITLEVIDAGWEPLQSISEASAKAEGYWENGKGYGCFETRDHRTDMTRDARTAFSQLWDSINGDRPGLAWKHSPLVWVLRFRPHLMNIDAYLERNAA